MRKIYFGIFLLLLGLNCTDHKEPTHQEIACGVSQEPKTLDPARAEEYGAALIAPSIYETLTTLSPDHVAPQPWLATHWEIRNAGRQYTFYLRPNIFFHDSTRFSAAAVKISFDRQIAPASEYFIQPNGGIYSQTMLGLIDSVSVVDSLTVTFYLKYPYAPFLNILASVGGAAILSPASLEKSKSSATFFPVSTGPFRFVDWKPKQTIRLESNLNYWNTPPEIDLSFHFSSEFEAQIQQFQRGGIDVIFSVSPNLRERFLFDSNSRIQIVQALSTFFLGLNCRNPFLNDKRVRQAIAAAIDKRKLVFSLYHGGAEIAETILPPQLQPFSRMLAGNPSVPGMGGIDFSTIPTLKFVFYRHSDRDLLVTKAVQMFLTRIGLKIDIQMIKDWDEFDAMMKSGHADLFLDGWGTNFADPDDFLFSLFHSESPANLFFYQNPEVDKLLELARSLFDLPKKRASIYQQIIRILHQDMPCVPLTHQLPMIITRNTINNFYINQLGYPIFNKVNKDDTSM